MQSLEQPACTSPEQLALLAEVVSIYDRAIEALDVDDDPAFEAVMALRTDLLAKVRATTEYGWVPRADGRLIELAEAVCERERCFTERLTDKLEAVRVCLIKTRSGRVQTKRYRAEGNASDRRPSGPETERASLESPPRTQRTRRAQRSRRARR